MTEFSKSSQDLIKICKILKRGEVVAAPTETAYGLLADAASSKAVAKLFKLKGRLAGKALPLIVSSLTMAKASVEFPRLAKKLARRFWPGPLTLVLSVKGRWPKGIVSESNMIGLRVPGSRWLRRLVARYGSPLTATSANLAGGDTLYDMAAVRNLLNQRGLKYMVNSRRLRVRPTSTVVMVVGGKWKILRPGAVSTVKLRSVIR